MKYSSPESFVLNTRLKTDTIFVMDLRLCTVLLMNDARFPWVILVPRVANAEEIFDLSRAEQTLLMEETSAVAKALDALYQPVKVNMAALGNQVRQLHMHVIARFEDDEAWPNPIWGVGKTIPYSEDSAFDTQTLREKIEEIMQSK